MKINEKIPNFCLPDQNNNNVCIDEFEGKWLVIYFYPKDNTPGCTKEANQFTEKLEEFKKLNCIVIGISPDSPSSHLNFIKKYNLQHYLLCDTNKEIIKKFGAWGIKKMYGKESEGVVRSTFIINPERKISYLWKNVKVETKKGAQTILHVDEVLSKLIELQKK